MISRPDNFARRQGSMTMKKRVLTIFAFGAAALLSACNTIDGIGEDVESVGDCADGVEGNC